MRRRDFIGVIYGRCAGIALRRGCSATGQALANRRCAYRSTRAGRTLCASAGTEPGRPGYVQGRTIVLLHRFAGAQVDRLEEAIISLVPQVDLLVVWGNAGMPAKRLAGGVPTVFISIGFPVELGLVQSLAHPAGNMTGIAAEAALEINGKRLQILKEIVPDLNRVAVLRDGWRATASNKIGAPLYKGEPPANHPGVRQIPFGTTGALSAR